MRISRKQSITGQAVSRQPTQERGDRVRASKKEGRGKTFDPGGNEIYWCETCNVPLLSMKCSICGNSGKRIYLSPPSDVRLCSSSGRDLLKEMFTKSYGWADFLEKRPILLNKIAGIDRRDQVFIDGHHIATLWFDITTGSLSARPGGSRGSHAR